MRTDETVRAPANYSTEEALRLLEDFSPIAAKYHQRRRIAFGAGAVGTVILVGSLLANGITRLATNHALFDKAPWYLSLPQLVLILGAVIGYQAMGRLRCPGCRGFLLQGIGRYCPTCGSDKLGTDWLGRPNCNSCGSSLYRVKGNRRYIVHHCTACGLLLDTEGM